VSCEKKEGGRREFLPSPSKGFSESTLEGSQRKITVAGGVEVHGLKQNGELFYHQEGGPLLAGKKQNGLCKEGKGRVSVRREKASWTKEGVAFPGS